MVKNENLTISWDPANTMIVIANTDSQVSISSNDVVVFGEGGYITANVTEQIHHDMMLLHVRYFFDTLVNKRILNLSPEDKDKAFRMFKDYADILDKMITASGFPIIEHILGKPWDAAMKNPHPGIDFDYNCQIIEQYDAWKANNPD